jgi:mycothiol synthase
MNAATSTYNPTVAIPGLRFRAPRGPADYGPMVAVYNACAGADDLDEVITEADLAAFLENPVNADPALDSLIVEIAGRVVGYTWMSHRPEASGDEVHQHRGYVHPAWRRRGIGRALVQRFWQRATAVPLGESLEARRFVQTYLHEGETEARRLMADLGYDPIRHALTMRRSLDEPIPDLPLPEGIELRAARPEHYRLIWEAQREAFRDHWGYAPWTEEHYQRFVAFPHHDPGLWCIAWHGDQVVGTVLNSINRPENERLRRRRGYTEDIAVVRPWRGRGLASALIARSLGRLRHAGMSHAALAVDAENTSGAVRLYERLGYAIERQISLVRRRLPIPAGVELQAEGP